MASVFISYARENAVEAQRLYADLTAAGIQCWLDSIDIAPGADWQLSIETAITQSRFFIALLSRHSVGKRGFVQREIRRALELLDEFAPSDVYIIPVRIDPCEPDHPRLAKLHWVDLFSDYAGGIERIAAAVKAIANREASKAPAAAAPNEDILSWYIAQLRAADSEERVRAARRLGELGSLAARAVVPLREALKQDDERLRNQAAEALSLIDKSAGTFALLFDQLASLRPSAGKKIIDELARTPDVAPAFLPAVRRIIESELASGEERLAWHIVSSLAAFGPEAPAILNELLVLDDSNQLGRLLKAEAAEVLGTLGAGAAIAIPNLQRAVYSDHYSVYRKAAEALYALGPEAVVSMVRLLEETRSPRLAYVCSFFENHAEAAIPTLIELLEGGQPAAAQGLGGIRSKPEVTVPALMKGARARDPVVRQCCVSALARYGPAALPALATLIAAMKDPDYKVRRDATYAIGKLGPGAQAALPALTRALADPEEKIRRYAGYSIAAIRGE